MLIIVGTLVTLLSVFGGYALAGGHLGALIQPVEILMIVGAGVGAFILGNGGKTIKATLRVLPTLFKGSKYTKDVYMELMALLYVLLAKARKEGTLTLEADIDDPEKSPIFTQYPKILADHHIVEFLTDYLRLMVGGNMNAFEIESLMDEEIETHHAEGEGPAHALMRVGDAMPAFGIVAAVMGVVHTMASADKPPAVLGAMIAQALVGTFLGILLSYGLIGGHWLGDTWLCDGLRESRAADREAHLREPRAAGSRHADEFGVYGRAEGRTGHGYPRHAGAQPAPLDRRAQQTSRRRLRRSCARRRRSAQGNRSAHRRTGRSIEQGVDRACAGRAPVAREIHGWPAHRFRCELRFHSRRCDWRARFLRVFRRGPCAASREGLQPE